MFFASFSIWKTEGVEFGVVFWVEFLLLSGLVLFSLPLLKEEYRVNTLKFVKVYQLPYAYSILYEAFQ